MNNTDLQVSFNKETKQQVLQTGKQMNLYYTDEYVRWLEDIALKQANDADTEQDKCHIQRVSFSEERAEVCDCTVTQACKICAASKDIEWDDEWDK